MDVLHDEMKRPTKELLRTHVAPFKKTAVYHALIRAVRNAVVEGALENSNGNAELAGRRFGINRITIKRVADKYGIDRGRNRAKSAP